MLPHKADEPSTFPLALPDYLDVHVHYEAGDPDIHIIQRCGGCRRHHDWPSRVSRGTDPAAVAIAFCSTAWGLCWSCGFAPELAQWEAAQNACAAELEENMSRLLAYDNLSNGSFVVKPRVPVPTIGSG